MCTVMLGMLPCTSGWGAALVALGVVPQMCCPCGGMSSLCGFWRVHEFHGVFGAKEVRASDLPQENSPPEPGKVQSQQGMQQLPASLGACMN